MRESLTPGEMKPPGRPRWPGGTGWSLPTPEHDERKAVPGRIEAGGLNPAREGRRLRRVRAFTQSLGDYGPAVSTFSMLSCHMASPGWRP